MNSTLQTVFDSFYFPSEPSYLIPLHPELLLLKSDIALSHHNLDFYKPSDEFPLMNFFFFHFFKLIGIGCASVLKTNLSNGIRELSLKSKYKYFSVSPRKKVSILSLLGGGILVTSSREQ